MVAYSFKPRFVAPIRAGLGLIGSMGRDYQGNEVPCELVLEDGKTIPRPFDPEIDLDPPITPKRQTIRADRRRHARPGEIIQLYVGMRTKSCKLIGEARCLAIDPIEIDFDLRVWDQGQIKSEARIKVGWNPARVYQSREDLDSFARSDGFANWLMMKTFWEEYHGLGKFRGVVIRWEPLP